MGTKTDLKLRGVSAIFAESREIGLDNVLINDAELGAILAGGTTPISPRTISNWRHTGRWMAPTIRGADRVSLTRLSDALKERDALFNRGAA